MKVLISISLALIASQSLFADGKKVFETYCWGCHHQSAVAFGPPFSEIASKRSAEEIRGMISNPKEVSKIFGYKRNAMPAFNLKEDELKDITEYILSFKPKSNESNKRLDKNSTKSK